MPSLRPLHWRTVERVALHLGYALYRTNGSHRIYVKEGELRHVTIPMHDPIPVGTLTSIIRQLGTDRANFLKLVEEVG